MLEALWWCQGKDEECYFGPSSCLITVHRSAVILWIPASDSLNTTCHSLQRPLWEIPLQCTCYYLLYLQKTSINLNEGNTNLCYNNNFITQHQEPQDHMWSHCMWPYRLKLIGNRSNNLHTCFPEKCFSPHNHHTRPNRYSKGTQDTEAAWGCVRLWAEVFSPLYFMRIPSSL